MLDKYGRKLKLTEERMQHILKREEMVGQEERIEETLSKPDVIRHSIRDETVHLYYKLYDETPVTQKYLLVAARILNKKGFIITAFFTDKVKKGEIIWQKE